MKKFIFLLLLFLASTPIKSFALYTPNIETKSDYSYSITIKIPNPGKGIVRIEFNILDGCGKLGFISLPISSDNAYHLTDLEYFTQYNMRIYLVTISGNIMVGQSLYVFSHNKKEFKIEVLDWVNLYFLQIQKKLSDKIAF